MINYEKSEKLKSASEFIQWAKRSLQITPFDIHARVTTIKELAIAERYLKECEELS